MVLAGAGLLATPLACGDSGAGSTTGSTTTTTRPLSFELVTGFESGTTRGLTDTAQARVTGAAAKNGRFGFEVDAAASDAYGRWDAGRDGPGLVVVPGLTSGSWRGHRTRASTSSPCATER